MERDLEHFTEDTTCPYCAGESFYTEAKEISPEEFLNTCMDCEEKSIYFEERQYKVIP